MVEWFTGNTSGCLNIREIRNDAGFYKVVACAPTPISRPMPRKCHLKFAGCFTMQIRCKTMRPTGYLAMVVINHLVLPTIRGSQGVLSKRLAGLKPTSEHREKSRRLPPQPIATPIALPASGANKCVPQPNSRHLFFKAIDFDSNRFDHTVLDHVNLGDRNAEQSPQLFEAPTPFSR